MKCHHHQLVERMSHILKLHKFIFSSLLFFILPQNYHQPLE
uniref:Uncharacterized protein n=1 Tax=Meloidogyne enterolobii TaxID=390850 RepID=A0A6V7YCQ6_MELEN|nr:unnamed protein product [Meloidogyne enterolobii]